VTRDLDTIVSRNANDEDASTSDILFLTLLLGLLVSRWFPS